MLVRDILSTTRTSISFEFFPPSSPTGWNRLYTVLEELQTLRPAYVSVTYGAGGSTRSRTHQLVSRLCTHTNLTVVAHLTCIGHTQSEIRSILDTYQNAGVHNILALRGDNPKNHKPGTADPGDFPHAADLVSFVRTHYPGMCIGVAGFPEGHPASDNRLKEMDHLKSKIDAGSDYIVTQLFFDNADYFDYVERCRLAGIRVPVIAGIMPITGRPNMHRMSDLSPRTRFPAGLIRSINRAQSDQGVENVGIHWATEQIRDLIDQNIAGIHLYTLNFSTACHRIVETLGLQGFDTLCSHTSV